MISKKLKFRGFKQNIVFLTEGDTITEDCFQIPLVDITIPYNDLVMRAIENFSGLLYSRTRCAGDSVDIHPERVYFKVEL